LDVFQRLKIFLKKLKKMLANGFAASYNRAHIHS
jgi:hypothetical protein